jgi:hypothetical protein
LTSSSLHNCKSHAIYTLSFWHSSKVVADSEPSGISSPWAQYKGDGPSSFSRSFKCGGCPRLLSILALAVLSGCAVTPSQQAAPVSVPGQTIEGKIRGGNQPVGGAHIYLFAANNIGYRAPSISLINPHFPGTATDSNGTYLITNTGGGLNQPYSIAIDASDNPWVANFGPINASTVSKFLASGSPATATPYPCSATCFFPAFDTTGDLWITAANRTIVLSPTGTHLAQFTTSAYNSGIVIDPFDHAWTLGLGSKLYRLTLPSAVSVYSESVTSPSATTELIPTALDASSNIWFVSSKNNAVGKSDPTGKPLSPARGYTGAGLNALGGIAIDGANTVWITNRNTNTISAFTNTGAAITPSTGYTADGISGPRGIAIDPSGNLWITTSPTTPSPSSSE